MVIKYKKLVLLTLVIVFSACSIFNKSLKKTINGTYFNEFGESIVINKNEFQFYSFDNTEIPNYKEIYAYGMVKNVKSTFFEIKTKDPITEVMKSFKVVKSFDPSLQKDSIKVSFLMPAKSNFAIDLEFENYGKVSTLVFDYSVKKNYAFIPKNADNLTFNIKPIKIKSNSLNNQHYLGLSVFSMSLPIKIENDVNYIQCLLPYLKDNFFWQYYIESDFIRIEDKTIYWNGSEFKK